MCPFKTILFEYCLYHNVARKEGSKFRLPEFKSQLFEAITNALTHKVFLPLNECRMKILPLLYKTPFWKMVLYLQASGLPHLNLRSIWLLGIGAPT